mmetsp:Transcript_43164/g.71306  ORF Transcript_43164/g.71306 Transcript_43164/m.71306 type:complete len:218 (-) Transcript_43164:124-777(-)
MAQVIVDTKLMVDAIKKTNNHRFVTHISDRQQKTTNQTICILPALNEEDSDLDPDFDPKAFEVEQKELEKNETAEIATYYDSNQFLASVLRRIQSNTFVHPFQCKQNAIPKRRLKKIMKMDPTHCKHATLSVECMGLLVVLFTRDLTAKAYKYTTKDKRKSLQLQDICRAVQSDHIYDFLIDIVPRIRSYDRDSRMYSFIYMDRDKHCTLTSNKEEI